MRKRKLLLGLALLFAIVFFSQSTAFANTGSFKYPGTFDNKYEVITGLSTYSPETGVYPFLSTAKTIGFPDLYGDSKGLVDYKGEVPFSLKDTTQGLLLRTTNTNKTDGKLRVWANDSGLAEADLTPDSTDVHIKALAETTSAGLPYYLFSVVSGINSLCSIPLKLIILLKNIDLSTILNAFGTAGSLSDLFNTLFLIAPDGTVSPFLIFMIILFIVSLIGVVIKVLKGEKSGTLVVQTFGWLLLAALIAGVALMSDSSILPKWSIDFATSMSNGISTGTSPDAALYSYSTGDVKKDNDATQSALLKKPMVDTYIEMQFGMPVTSLDLDKTSFGQGQNAAIKKVTGSYKGFNVSNGGIEPINNLGYYLWAANSNVNTNPIGSNGAILESSNSRVLNVVDFLNDARISAVTNKDTATVNKIDKIMQNLWSPDYGSGIAKVFLLAILNIALSYSLILVVFFMSFGKIVIILGFFAVPILPGLLLFDKTRNMAKTLTKTYVASFARYIVGLLCFTFVITISTILSNQGNIGVILAIVVCYLLARAMPALIQEVNRIVSRNEADFMRTPSSWMDSYAKTAGARRSKGVRHAGFGGDGKTLGVESQDLSYGKRGADVAEGIKDQVHKIPDAIEKKKNGKIVAPEEEILPNREDEEQSAPTSLDVPIAPAATDTPRPTAPKAERIPVEEPEIPVKSNKVNLKLKLGLAATIAAGKIEQTAGKVEEGTVREAKKAAFNATAFYVEQIPGGGKLMDFAEKKSSENLEKRKDKEEKIEKLAVEARELEHTEDMKRRGEWESAHELHAKEDTERVKEAKRTKEADELDAKIETMHQKSEEQKLNKNTETEVGGKDDFPIVGGLSR